MPHARPEDLPEGGGGRWPLAGAAFRAEQWGDMEVCLTTVSEARDYTDIYSLAGLPNGVCPCPHYGYVFSGRVRAIYPGTDRPDEVAAAGEAYFFPAGHVLVYEEPTSSLEINPAPELTTCMDAVESAGRRFLATAASASAEVAQQPSTLEEALDPGWLSAALGERFPGVQVEEVACSHLDARISTNAALTASFAAEPPPGLPAELYLKGYFGEFAEAGRRTGLIEASFYRDLAPTLGLRTPACVYTDADETGLLITADLTAQGASFPDPRKGLSPDQVACGLEQLAVLHGETWRSPELADTWWLAPRFLRTLEVRADVVEVSLRDERGAGVPDAARDPERLLAAARRVGEDVLTAEDWSVVHGDPHPGNVYLDAAGRTCLLDWQLVHRGPWYIDVGYHIAASLDPEERRRHERELLRCYLERLTAAGGTAPPLEESLDLVRRGQVQGFLMWSVTSRVLPATTAVLLHRLGTAVADSGALDLAGHGSTG